MADQTRTGRWARFKSFTRAMGNFQWRVLLNLFFVVLWAPCGFVARLVSDPLAIKRRPESLWLPRRSQPDDLETARSQT